jgi:hypothetical protein
VSSGDDAVGFVRIRPQLSPSPGETGEGLFAQARAVMGSE